MREDVDERRVHRREFGRCEQLVDRQLAQQDVVVGDGLHRLLDARVRLERRRLVESATMAWAAVDHRQQWEDPMLAVALAKEKCRQRPHSPLGLLEHRECDLDLGRVELLPHVRERLLHTHPELDLVARAAREGVAFQRGHLPQDDDTNRENCVAGRSAISIPC